MTAHLTDPERYRGRMLDMLRNEVRYTTIRRSLPGDFHSATRRVGKATLFGAAELIAGVELRAGDWIVEPAGEPPYGTAEPGGSP